MRCHNVLTTLCCCLVRTQKLNTLPLLSTLSVRLSDQEDSFRLKILTCWIDTSLIHVFGDFTGFAQCTLQTCVRRFHSYQCNSVGPHVLSTLVVMRLDNSGCLMSIRREAFSVHSLLPNVNSLDTARLQIPTVSVPSPCNSIRIVHRVLSWRALSASSVPIVI